MKLTAFILALLMAASVQASVAPIALPTIGHTLTTVAAAPSLSILKSPLALSTPLAYSGLHNPIVSAPIALATQTHLPAVPVATTVHVAPAVQTSSILHVAPAVRVATPAFHVAPIVRVATPAVHVAPAILPLATAPTYAAVNAGAVHVTTLPGHAHSTHVINVRKAPGTK